ncbi:NUDIX hydrolase [Tropicimonas sp. IMCC34043]|uniref:NUDIX hydrolase n=1 Tax=Tropicimonas sp. IMCC34043 TaxID=2248760 RepID=UPI000E23E04C|nr:NUDIX hydrolase [Tropicimonas sp. IMCC34043]
MPARDGKTATRTQIAALCFRKIRGKSQVLLITSRTQRRWIIPKGWPMAHTTPAGAAAIEAWEEAGVRGRIHDICIGLFSYAKLDEASGVVLPCVVTVFPLEVKSLAKDFPERKQRRRSWFTPRQAAKKVAEPELREILREFDPRLWR